MATFVRVTFARCGHAISRPLITSKGFCNKAQISGEDKVSETPSDHPRDYFATSLSEDAKISVYSEPIESWVETLDGRNPNNTKLGTVALHPEVFGAFPRTDIIHWNIYWQKMYKMVDWSFAMTREEKRGGGRKPRPQKGTGRSRQGSIRSPLFYRGGVAMGPRGPRTYFFMPPFHLRVLGLVSTLSCKFAQDDIHIVDGLESLPSDDSKFLEELCEAREWGPSVLFVNETDYAPRNITLATDPIGHLNIMPVQGLNVYSMLKHETLVLSLKAAQLIQERLLFHLSRPDAHKMDEYKVRPIINRPAPVQPLEYLTPTVTL